METTRSFKSLTVSQKVIWNVETLHSNTGINNIVGILKAAGDINFSLAEETVNIVIQKNEILRTRITEIAGLPIQYVDKFEPKAIDHIDLSHYSNEEVLKWYEAQAQSPLFKMNSDLLYFAIIKLSEKEFTFFIKIHHIIADGATLVLFANQFSEYYTKLNNRIPLEDENKPSYFQYYDRQKDYHNSDRFQENKKYWSAKFESLPELFSLQNATEKKFEIQSSRKTFKISDKTQHSINKFCKENNIHAFNFFISVLYLYLNKTYSKKDIVIGVPINDRSSYLEQQTMGTFVYTVPVRLSVNTDADFMTLVKQAAYEMRQVYRAYRYPYDNILNEFRRKHKVAANLFDIILNYEYCQFDFSGIRNPDLKISTNWVFHKNQTEAYTLHISDRENSGSMNIDFDYLNHLFSGETIENMYTHILNLITNVIDTPSKKIAEIELISKEEKLLILHEFNNTEGDYPKNSVIHSKFEEQVKKTPSAIALVFKNKKLTYKKLNEKANQVAQFLRNKEIKPNDIVGIIANRSFEMVIGILGILKAGAAYLPIDPELPENRINYIINDSKINLLLTQKSLENKLTLNCSVIAIDGKHIVGCKKSNLPNSNTSDDLAYVIYTSGSTGNPKGVLIEHRGVLNLSDWFNKKYCIQKNRNIIQNTTFSFDVSVEEIIVTLLNGGTLFMPHYKIISNISKFITYLTKNRINIIQFVPASLKEYLFYIPKIESLNVIICGGEALDDDLKNAITEKGYNLYNHYGPSEITVDAIVAQCTTRNKVVLGKPIDNVKAFILDKDFNIKPIGSEGELFISSPGIARGYLNNPDLTKEKFIECSFLPGEKLYKTGDLVKYLPDGNIEFIGRIDSQVKIRGNRIELNEIKHLLLKYPLITEAIVTTKTNYNNQKNIVAYLVPKSEETIDVDKLRAYLAKELPKYMIPTYFIAIENVPLLFNGKTDMNALPNPEKNIVDLLKKQQYKAPRNEIEIILANVLTEVLEISKIGVNDDFFDLGIDSLTIIKVIYMLTPYNLNLSPKDFYTYSSINKLAKKATKANKIRKGKRNTDFMPKAA
jgi:amino acid adenylation domain-containing protein